MAAGAKGDGHIDGVGADDGRDGVVEVEVLLAGEFAEGPGEGGRGERAGGDEGRAGRDVRHFLAAQVDARVLRDGSSNQVGEALTVDGQGAAGGHGSLCGAGEQEGAHAAGLFLQQPEARSTSCEPRELLQTSSARRSVTWAPVLRLGRISQRVTSMPRCASCQAASLPARPPPMTGMAALMGVGARGG